MPPAPKRAISVSITNFNPAEQRLLQIAFHAFVTVRAFVLVGGLEDGDARVIPLGHPDGLAPTKNYPPGARTSRRARCGDDSDAGTG